MDFTLETARQEKDRLLAGEDTKVLHDCITCYACEEYCPNNNHPFYLIVERQEEMGILPAPMPILKQQLVMMGPKGKLEQGEFKEPFIDMCAFPMLKNSIQGKLYENTTMASGTDIFCNIMWLHFARNSVIRERMAEAIHTLKKQVLDPHDIQEVICFHDECYAAYMHTAKAFSMEVPFHPVHHFTYLNQRLDALKEEINPLNVSIAYQRPCSNRLIPETDAELDEVFAKIGVTRVNRRYDRENALCCGGVVRAHQKDNYADDLVEKNIEDMLAHGAAYCVFNCPFCMATLGEAVAEKGLFPILVGDLCRLAVDG